MKTEKSNFRSYIIGGSVGLFVFIVLLGLMVHLVCKALKRQVLNILVTDPKIVKDVTLISIQECNKMVISDIHSL